MAALKMKKLPSVYGILVKARGEGNMSMSVAIGSYRSFMSATAPRQRVWQQQKLDIMSTHVSEKLQKDQSH